MLEEVLPPSPGMNRALRRQLARAHGERGSKSKRRRKSTDPQQRFLGPPPPEVRDAMIAQLNAERAEVEDHEERNRLRRLGILVPPSAAEAKALRAQGRPVGGGALTVVGQA